MNIKYELEALERILANQSLTLFPLEEIEGEVQRIKEQFTKEVITFLDERHLKRYIKYHQQGLIGLMDKLVESVGPTAVSQNGYYEKLNELLAFLERKFAGYFDHDAKAPLSYIWHVRTDASVNLKKIRHGLLRLNADPELLNVFAYAYKKFINSNATRDQTFRKIAYVKEVKKELLRILVTTDSIHDVNEELRQAIYYLDFNSVKCFIYHTRYISNLLSESETRVEKIETLSLLMKRINQAQPKIGLSYNSRSLPLKDQLNSYIGEEMNYLERMQLIFPQNRDLANRLASFKIKLDISVSQLAFLVNVFTSLNIIQNKNITELLKFLASCTETKKSEGVSFDSFRAKYYNIEVGTRQSP